MKDKRDKKDKIEERSLIFIWTFMVIVIPMGLFIIVNTSMGWGFKPKFIADNVLIYYGTIIGSCLSGAITFIGLFYTLKQNSKNLEQQKKDLDENFQNELDLKIIETQQKYLIDAIQNCNDLKSHITYFAIAVLVKIDNNSERVNYLKDEVKKLLKSSLDTDFYYDKIIKFIDNEEKEMMKKAYDDLKKKTTTFVKQIDNYLLLKEYNLSKESKNLSEAIESYREILNQLHNKKDLRVCYKSKMNSSSL